jgi:hypothetical protein
LHPSAWQLWIGDFPIINDIDHTIYSLAHTPATKKYWTQKSRATDSSFESVHWLRLGQALAKMPHTRRLFCTKHTVGMCGIGKFQKLWKARETDECPHCGLVEDALHVWTCKSQQVSDVWSTSLCQLKTSLDKLETDPALTKLIIEYLNAWRNDHNLCSTSPHEFTELLHLQDNIGARQFFEGWIHKEWEATQERYYREKNFRRSRKRWTIALITKMWDVAWDLWEYRNTFYHQQANYSQATDTSLLD